MVAKGTKSGAAAAAFVLRFFEVRCSARWAGYCWLARLPEHPYTASGSASERSPASRSCGRRRQHRDGAATGCGRGAGPPPRVSLHPIRASMVFAIVAFTTVLDYDASSRIKFLMFTGISGFIIALIFTIAYAAGVGAARGIVAMVLDLIWAIFWVVAASCATSVLKDYSDVADSKLKAGVAFSWLAWVLWYISFNLSLRDWRACKPCPAATGTGPPGSAPNSPANTV
ncbi:hypothetical protein ABPG75_002374 [Micractinium tetrahymenae]